MDFLGAQAKSFRQAARFYRVAQRRGDATLPGDADRERQARGNRAGDCLWDGHGGWSRRDPDPTRATAETMMGRGVPWLVWGLISWALVGAVRKGAWASSSEGEGGGKRPARMIRIEDGGLLDEANVRTARETQAHSTSTPVWTNAPGFEWDVFIFARLLFQSDPGARSGRGLGPKLGWWVDYPDADLNLSWRLQQMTSMRTDPDCRVVRLTDPDLHGHPLLYLEHAGYMSLTEEEVAALRKYLQAGGVLFVNDFWSAREWDGFARQIERAIPDARWTDLTTGHPIFHCLFDLRRPMHEMRVPTMQLWNEDFDPNDPSSDPHRIFRGEGSEAMSVRALLDSAGRMQVLVIHNSDVSDGWEREGENDRYFNRFSERIAYPLGMNILFYLMTH